MPVVTDDQIISLHTAKGTQLWQFLPEDYSDSTWTRRLRDAGSATLTLPPQEGLENLPDIVPWVHWVSIYDGPRDVLLWTGPIQKARANRRGLSLEVKDSGAFLARTRNPMTKRWDGADPSTPAGELWSQMIEAQALNVKAIVRPDPEGERFDFQVITDEQMLDKTIGELVQLGLRWTVVSGIPIIGPVGLDPIASLSEEDFQGDGIDLVRDGSATYNDVLVRGPDNLARARVDYYGQNLQTIANLDSMFGVGNVQRAADQYVRNTGAVRTRLELSSSTALHPDAPVDIDELMPSTRFVIEAAGLRQLVELTTVEVARRAGSATVSVTMDSLPDRDSEGNLIELEEAQSEGQPVMTLGGQAMTR